MGATTTISVFHHDRYRSCVVPALRRLLRSGELGPWLQAVWDHRQSHYPAAVGRQFSFEPNGNDETRLDADLLPTQAEGAEWFYLPGRYTIERANVAGVFQQVVQSCCLGESAELLTTSWAEFGYDDDDLHPVLFDVLLHLEDRRRVQELLARLGTGALNWGEGEAGEGILGWLDPTETAILARELHRLPLPDQPPEPAQVRAVPWGYYAHLSLFSLFQIRQIADHAWGSGHGILCGSGLEHLDAAAPHPAYATQTVQLLTRAIRDRREFDVLPVLADALQEAGCENDVVLAHCRDADEHTDACWVADLILANGPPATGGS